MNPKMNLFDEYGVFLKVFRGWRPIKFRGMKAIVFDGRPRVYPTGFLYFFVRHSPEDWDDPTSIEGNVCCNFWGVLGIRKRDFYLKLNRKEKDLIRGRP